MKRLGVFLIVGLLEGCAHDVALRGVETVHAPDASRIWVIRRNNNSTVEHVILCDSSYLQTRERLCVEWTSTE